MCYFLSANGRRTKNLGSLFSVLVFPFFSRITYASVENLRMNSKVNIIEATDGYLLGGLSD